MTVKELASLKEFKSVVLPEPKREICGVYIGDLLSWVMGRASSNDAWIILNRDFIISMLRKWFKEPFGLYRSANMKLQRTLLPI